MFIRLIYLYIFILCSMIFSQSYFNRIIGGDIQFGDARSMAMGNSYITTGSTSSVTSVNPARLSYLANGNKHFLFDIQFNGFMYYERRSISILDSFDEFLAETDYVSNQHYNFYNSLGIIFTAYENKSSSLGFGLSLMPLTSFNYIYEEEVRYEISQDDGEIGGRDPLLGYHVYKNNGSLDILSFGIGYSKKIGRKRISLGFSKNWILKSEISDKMYVDTLFNSQNIDYYVNLANVQEHSVEYKTPKVSYKTFSIEVPIPYGNNSSLVLASEEFVMVKSEDYSGFNISNISGLPWFLDFNENDELTFMLEGIQYLKPKKLTFGLRLNSGRSLFIFENKKEFYYDIFDDVHDYKIAFEYRFMLGTSIRMGLSHKDPIMQAFSPVNKFTLGSNKSINDRFNIDFALSYSITSYRYADIFPVEYPLGYDCNADCEKVTESNLSLSTTLKWNF